MTAYIAMPPWLPIASVAIRRTCWFPYACCVPRRRSQQRLRTAPERSRKYRQT